MRRGFTIIELVLAIVLLGILASAVVSAINPLEQARIARDSHSRDKAVTVIDAIDAYFKKVAKFPWQGDALPWTKVGSENSGISKVVESELLQASVVNQTKDFFLGRGNSKDSLPAQAGKVYACFIPQSQTQRVDKTKLKEVRQGDNLPANGQPRDCKLVPNWQNTFCYVCVTN